MELAVLMRLPKTVGGMSDSLPVLRTLFFLLGCFVQSRYEDLCPFLLYLFILLGHVWWISLGGLIFILIFILFETEEEFIWERGEV